MAACQGIVEMPTRPDHLVLPALDDAPLQCQVVAMTEFEELMAWSADPVELVQGFPESARAVREALPGARVGREVEGAIKNALGQMENYVFIVLKWERGDGREKCTRQ